MLKDKDWDEIDEIILEKYPETYFYYALGKIFGWPPNIVDELDIELCQLLIAIDIKRNEEETPSRGQPIKEKPRSMPKEWETMSVKDIMESNEFKKREKDNQDKLKAMKNTHGGQTEVIKNYVKIQ